MWVTIIKEDGKVGVDRVFRNVDLSDLFEGVRVVQWDGTAGHVEHDDMTNTALDSIDAFQPFVDLWTAAAPPAPTLADIKLQQIATLTAAYITAIQQPVAYMSTTFNADIDSQNKAVQVLAAMTPAGSTPSGFFWVDADNNQVPMSLANVQGLAQAMMAQGWQAFQHLQDKKQAVNTASTIGEVQAVTW
jgi:Domain of unknown function (DUF4376)